MARRPTDRNSILSKGDRDFMDCVKMDDPRLDESFSLLFVFKKGDTVARKDDPSLRGEIRDGVYVGEFPKAAAGKINSRGRTLYEVAISNDVLYVVDQIDIEKLS
jgi:hypothetical protein